MSHVVIEAKGVVTRFGDQTIHDGVSFAIHHKEIFGLLGGSGSGKTTLLREMILLQRLSGGALHVLGDNVTTMHRMQKQTLRQQWGVLFQFGALYSSLTILENVMLPMQEYTKLPHILIEEAARTKLSMVGLPPKVLSMFPSELSGGMKKRAALARALALDPKLLFLDEPTSGLDPQSARAFDRLITELRDSLSISVVMVTHDSETIKHVLDRFIILGNKKVLFEGNSETLKETQDPLLRTFIA